MNNNIYRNGLKPPLKWAGGKRWIVPHILPIWEQDAQGRLVEPLCGGLCRFNQKDEFNVPFGSYKNINYVTDFTPYKTVFQQWEFTYG